MHGMGKLFYEINLWNLCFCFILWTLHYQSHPKAENHYRHSRHHSHKVFWIIILHAFDMHNEIDKKVLSIYLLQQGVPKKKLTSSAAGQRKDLVILSWGVTESMRKTLFPSSVEKRYEYEVYKCTSGKYHN